MPGSSSELQRYTPFSHCCLLRCFALELLIGQTSQLYVCAKVTYSWEKLLNYLCLIWAEMIPLAKCIYFHSRNEWHPSYSASCIYSSASPILKARRFWLKRFVTGWAYWTSSLLSEVAWPALKVCLIQLYSRLLPCFDVCFFHYSAHFSFCSLFVYRC